MKCDALDTIYVAVPDLESACRPLERLGLRLGPAQDGRRTLYVGGPSNLLAVQFIADAGRETPLIGPLRHALAIGRGLFAIGLRTDDLSAAVGRLASRHVSTVTYRNGSRSWLALRGQAGTDIVLLQHTASLEQRHEGAQRAGLLDHAFPLRRLDHLAAVAPDLETMTRYWADKLSVPLTGEVANATMRIRQLRIGDAIFELLGPAGADSPILQRPAGLVSMVSWQVEDLDAVVAHARAAGFPVPDPVTGVLPGTRVASIPGTELAGVTFQLLQYV